jgi:hypothetical protein
MSFWNSDLVTQETTLREDEKARKGLEEESDDVTAA